MKSKLLLTLTCILFLGLFGISAGYTSSNVDVVSIDNSDRLSAVVVLSLAPVVTPVNGGSLQSDLDRVTKVGPLFKELAKESSDPDRVARLFYDNIGQVKMPGVDRALVDTFGKNRDYHTSAILDIGRGVTNTVPGLPISSGTDGGNVAE